LHGGLALVMSGPAFLRICVVATFAAKVPVLASSISESQRFDTENVPVNGFLVGEPADVGTEHAFSVHPQAPFVDIGTNHVKTEVLAIRSGAQFYVPAVEVCAPLVPLPSDLWHPLRHNHQSSISFRLVQAVHGWNVTANVCGQDEARISKSSRRALKLTAAERKRKRLKRQRRAAGPSIVFGDYPWAFSRDGSDFLGSNWARLHRQYVEAIKVGFPCFLCLF
jgi:hypothetical protein